MVAAASPFRGFSRHDPRALAPFRFSWFRGMFLLAMTIDTVRDICRRLPAVTEDVKWGNDLCFCVSGKMFAIVDLDPPHSIAFKCTPEQFWRARRAAGNQAGALHGAKPVGSRGAAGRGARSTRARSAGQDVLRSGRRKDAEIETPGGSSTAEADVARPQAAWRQGDHVSETIVPERYRTTPALRWRTRVATDWAKSSS